MLIASGVSHAAVITWTDWISGSGTTVTGTIGGVGVTYTGAYEFLQTGTGINYWTENGNPAPYTGNSVIDNAPTSAEMIALNLATTHTLTFSSTLFNPIMAIVSQGRPGVAVTYDFDTDFRLLSNGVGYWSFANGAIPAAYSIDSSLNTLTGSESHGAIQFNGAINSFSWTTAPGEDWHGITIGVVNASAPSMVGLLSLGLCLIFARSKSIH